MTDRREDTSGCLTEIRTVLSRAETAIASIERDRAEDGDTRARWVEGGWQEYAYETDPDADYMLAALRGVVAMLEPWRGKNKSRGQRDREWWDKQRREWEESAQ